MCSRTPTPDPDLVMDPNNNSSNNNKRSNSKERGGPSHHEMVERQEPRRAPSLLLPEPENFERSSVYY
jgi:hypothetical protein